MDFDKTKVYTSLNADELKIGSKILASDNLKSLKSYVIKEYKPQTLEIIRDEGWCKRFKTVEREEEYILAYLISKPIEKVEQ